MYIKLNLIAVLFVQQSVQLEIIFVATFDKCEGKDTGNYTAVSVNPFDASCCQQIGGSITIIQNLPNKEKSIIGVQGLTGFRYPAGADVTGDSLVLFTSGSLTGKFGYFRIKHLVLEYWKKCSSVLGLSLVSSTSIQLMISDKLEPNVLISPTGAYDAFKKGCTTICTGSMWGV